MNTAKITTQKSVPNLRFPGFSDEWQIYTLESLAKIGTGNKDTQNKIKDGKYPFFVRSDKIECINSYSYDGEAILTSGDGVGVGKNFHYIIGKFDYHQRVYAIRDFSNNVNGKYVYFYFKDRFYKRVMRLSAKNSVDSVRMEMISEMPIALPQLAEQEKIADFLTTIDEKINILEQKLKLMQKYKKAVMQKIFTQQVRFKDKTGQNFADWQRKKLGDTFKRITFKNTENNQNILTISAQQGLVSQTDYFNKIVAAKNVTNYYLLRKNDFAYNKSYSVGYPMGAIKKLNDYSKGVVSTLYICFRAMDERNVEFFEQLFETGLQNAEIEKVAQEGARNHGLLNIAVADFFNILVFTPTDIEEKQKIADFLKSIDDRITQEQNKLKLAKSFKKSLLQRMFV